MSKQTFYRAAALILLAGFVYLAVTEFAAWRMRRDYQGVLQNLSDEGNRTIGAIRPDTNLTGASAAQSDTPLVGNDVLQVDPGGPVEQVINGERVHLERDNLKGDRWLTKDGREIREPD